MKKPFDEVSGNNFDPSVIVMFLGHHEKDIALKTPAITDKDGLNLLMSLGIFSKLDKSQIHYYFG